MTNIGERIGVSVGNNEDNMKFLKKTEALIPIMMKPEALIQLIW